MESKEARQKLLELFGRQIKVNKDFDFYFSKLKEGMQLEFLQWCQNCKDNKELGSVPKKKEYKQLYVFFRKIASDVRAIVIKEQNKEFIEIILTGHKYYDDTRLRLGFKKSSYYGS